MFWGVFKERAWKNWSSLFWLCFHFCFKGKLLCENYDQGKRENEIIVTTYQKKKAVNNFFWVHKMTIRTCLRFRETQEVRLLTSTGTVIAASQYISSHFIASCKLLHLTHRSTIIYYPYTIHWRLRKQTKYKENKVCKDCFILGYRVTNPLTGR